MLMRFHFWLMILSWRRNILGNIIINGYPAVINHGWLGNPRTSHRREKQPTKSVMLQQIMFDCQGVYPSESCLQTFSLILQVSDLNFQAWILFPILTPTVSDLPQIPELKGKSAGQANIYGQENHGFNPKLSRNNF